jgi:cytochrome c biogenesis protein CcmG, thiol:disulfide interchange protein DsbE
MRRLVPLVLGIALVAVLVIGLTQAGDKTDGAAKAPLFDLSAAKAKLQSAPAPLGSLYAQANTLLPGGKDAFEKRIADLNHPAVVNKWASWCRPCRAEFPIFQHVATQRGTQIAFLGINGADKDPAAKKFLAERPLPYPSYVDPHEEIAQERKVPKLFPYTLFIDADGKTVHTHAGEYTSTADLNADIDRYLG